MVLVERSMRRRAAVRAGTMLMALVLPCLGCATPSPTVAPGNAAAAPVDVKDVASMREAAPDAKPALVISPDDERYVGDRRTGERQVLYRSADTGYEFVVREDTGAVLEVRALPEAPWPPPTTQLMLALRPYWARDDTDLDDAYQRIRQAVEEAQYPTFGLFRIREEGFVVATHPERVDAAGVPDAKRWALAREDRAHKDLWDWLLDRAPEGHFRFFLIAVTPDLRPPSGSTQPDWKEAVINANVGSFPSLPDRLGALKFGPSYRLFVCGYMFTRERGDRLPHPAGTDRSIIDHMRAAGIVHLVEPEHKENTHVR